MKSVADISATASTLLTKASGTMLIRLIGAGLAFLTQILLARLLGVQEYGIYAFAMIWVLVGGQIGSFGFGESATKFLAQYHTDGKLQLARGFNFSSTIFVLSSNLLIAIAVFLLLFFNKQWVDEPYLIPIFISLACILVFSYQDLLEGKALAFSWNFLAFVPSYVGRQGLNLIFILAIVLSEYELNANTALLAMLAGSLVTCIIQHLIISKRLRTKFEKGTRYTSWPVWRQTIAPVAFREAIYVLGRNLDVILIGLFLSAQNMAIYFAATRLTGILNLFHFSITTAALSKFATNTVERNKAELIELVGSSTKMIFWATAISYLLLLLFGLLLLELFGEGFSDGYWLLAILGLGIVAYASMGAAEDILIMHDHASKTMITQAAAVGTTLLLSLLLLPALGAIGAAISMAAGLIVASILLDHYLRRHVEISTFLLTLKKQESNN